jgi:hypothetical protein
MTVRKPIEPPHNVKEFSPAQADWLERLRRRYEELDAAFAAIPLGDNSFTIPNNSDQMVLPYLVYGRDARGRVELANGSGIVAQWQALTRASPNQVFRAIKQGTSKVFLAERGDFVLMSPISIGYIANDVPGKIRPFEAMTSRYGDTPQEIGNFFSNKPDAKGLLDFDLDIQFSRSTGVQTP